MCSHHVLPFYLNRSIGYDSTPFVPDASSGARANFAGWVARNGCAGNTTSSCWIPPAGNDTGYEIAAGAACDPGAEAALVTLPSVGHNPYPKAAPKERVPDTTRLAWDFMKRFPLEDDAQVAGPWHGECDPAGVPGDVVLAAPPPHESAVMLPAAQCAPCLEAAMCYDHTTGACGEDGVITALPCAPAVSICGACFPNSRCGGAPVAPAHESASFVQGDRCPAALAECEKAAFCYDHTTGACGEDGVISEPNCALAVPACDSCFPNSRCGGPSASDGDNPADHSDDAGADKPDSDADETTKAPTAAPIKVTTAAPVKSVTVEPTQGSAGAERGSWVSSMLLMSAVIFNILRVD